MDWKDMLSDILKPKPTKPGAEAIRASRPTIERFLNEVGLPALQEVRSELQQHGRQVKLERDTAYLALTVLDEHGHEEFYYSIRIRTTRPATFAFPELAPREPEKTVSRAEVLLRSGPASFDVSGLTREQLIRHFLHEYRKWIGWRNAGESPRG
jgi:choline/glycine/proline betaine transport protein